MSSNTYGRQVVIPMTNGSGGGVIAGDVVIVNTGANLSFTTTTSAGFTGMVGVAQETIANAAVGRVLLSGYAALINVNASVTRGNFGKTFTVAKQTSDAGSSRGVGTFCQFLTGGTTPDAVVYPVDLLGSSLTNPMTTKGDIIQADTGGTPTRLAAGTSGFVLTAGGAGAFSAWAAPAGATALTSARYIRTTGDYTTTSGTFVDVDATNLALTITTGAHRVLLGFVGSGYNSNTSGGVALTIMVDAVDQNSASLGYVFDKQINTANENKNLSFTFLTDVLSAASHTFKLRWHRGSAGTGTLSGSDPQLEFYAMEQGG